MYTPTCTLLVCTYLHVHKHTLVRTHSINISKLHVCMNECEYLCAYVLMQVLLSQSKFFLNSSNN